MLTRSQFAVWLRARRDAGETLVEIGRILGVTGVAVSKWLNCSSGISNTVLLLAGEICIGGPFPSARTHPKKNGIRTNHLLRLVALVALLLCSLGARAQSTAAIQRHCYLGGTKAITQGLSSTNFNLGIVPACTVTVYLTGTTNKATIFSDGASTPLSNPFTANATNSVDPGGWIFWAAVNTGYDIVMSGGGGNPNCTTVPNCYTQPVTLTDLYPSFSFSGGGANLPHVTQIISGDGTGNGVGMPEKGTNVGSGNAWVAWNEDNGLDGAHGGGLGLFDCRDTKYGPGGCLGTHPQQAMQDLANDLVCFNHSTGLAANITFPPGVIPIGTAAAPTLKLPAGNYYFGDTGFSGIATQFNATYNNVGALEFDENLTATCSGTVVTDTQQQGAYIGFNVHGCGQGGCVNIPGDSTSYANGGPNQTGVLFNDDNGWVDKVGADHNGADGITVAGVAPITGTLFAVGNNAYYYFGKGSPPYNPSTDGIHYNINLAGQDGWFNGPNVTYGYLNAPGTEFGHVAEVGWGGFTSHASNIFINRGSIGIVRESGSEGGHLSDFRIDGPQGPGLVAQSGADWFKDGTISSACLASNVAWSSVASVTIANGGSGQNDGVWGVTATGGLATTGGIDGNGGAAGTNAVISLTIAGGVATGVTLTNPGAKYAFNGSLPVFNPGQGGTPATFTVTMTPPLQIQTIGGIQQPFCDYIQDGGTGDDHYDSILNQASNFFGPDYSTGGLMPDASAFWRQTTGFMETPPGASTGSGQNIEPYLQSIQATTGTNPRVDLGGLIQPSDSSATNIVGVNHAWIGEVITVIGGNANDTLISSLNGGAWITNSGYNINLAPHSAWNFIVTGGTNFGNPPILQELGPSIDMNHWWVNHAGNAGSLPPLVQQGTVDSMGDIRSHAIPALPGLHVQAGGTPDGVHGFAGTWTYAYRVWGPWGTQTSAVTPNVNQCMPAAGFVNNPCFQTPGMTLPEGFTRYVLTRESTTDSVATAGTIADVTFTTPQHAASVTFADTYIPPINGNTIGSANYSANMTGGIAPDQCASVPPVSAYPAVAGQVCMDYAGGFKYHADSTDHWQRTAQTYANF